MKFIVQDRNAVEDGILVKSNYVLISIRDPDSPTVRIPKQSGLKDVLRLAFHDAEPAASMSLPDGITLMSAGQARQVWAFVRKWEDKVGAVVIHCEQGMSRSPAVAAALCRACGDDESFFFQKYQPNKYVYDLMVDCDGDGRDDPQR